MKTICFSFDDGRADVVENALPIMNKYGFHATLNVISDWVIHPSNYKISDSAIHPVSTKQMHSWLLSGNELALHGSTHKNSTNDVLRNITELNEMGFYKKKYGFASPESFITEKNICSLGFDSMLENGKISYIRSGIQIRREGLFFMVLSFIEMITHSSILFTFLNKKNIFMNKKRIYPSVAIKSYTTLQQVKFLIKHLKENETVILLFHSILQKQDEGYGKDSYFWDGLLFEQLCEFLAKEKIKVVSTEEIANLFR